VKFEGRRISADYEAFTLIGWLMISKFNIPSDHTRDHPDYA